MVGLRYYYQRLLLHSHGDEHLQPLGIAIVTVHSGLGLQRGIASFEARSVGSSG